VAPSIVEAGIAANFENAVLMWRRFTLAGRRAGTRLADRYLEITYEELVDDPEAVLVRVCSFLELTYRPEMLTYPDRSRTKEAALDPVDHHLGHRPTHTRDWRDRFTSEESVAFDELAGDALVAFGYEGSARHSYRHSYERARAYGVDWRARGRASLALARSRSLGANGGSA
jgi:hypothetical protein